MQLRKLHRATIKLTGRVQHIIEVQVQVALQEVTVLLLQPNHHTKQVHLQKVLAAVLEAAAEQAEVVVHHRIRVVLVVQEALEVQAEVLVHHLLAEDKK